MKRIIKELIMEAVKKANEQGDLPSSELPVFTIEEPKIEAHGDFSTNIAMVMASIQKMPPRKIAEAILKHLEDTVGIFEKTRIAGPGFVNFFINKSFWLPVLRTIHQEDTRYGASETGKGTKVQVEFVSANPTGPLHVGHGRGAAVGDVVGNIMSFCGYDVQKEYYVNDSGRQIKTLGLSVFMRYKELLGETVEFPGDCYQGEYIYDIAKSVIEKKGNSLLEASEEETAVSYCAGFAAKVILDGIRKDLDAFGVDFDTWYSEQSLFDSGKVALVINDLRDRKIVYEKDGALWFKTSDFGDEKDRVVVRSNGQTTYFASDIAYHQDKFDRGFDRVVDVWGADHHGYIPRIKASIEAAGNDKDRFDVILVQLVNLLRDAVPVAMSTRSGEFVTLQDVINEVGRDAARFIFLTRHYESSLDFDLELAKKKTNDNPVYYVQYVHARISSIFRKAREERGMGDVIWNEDAVAMLKAPEEIRLIKSMARYPEVIRDSAQFMEPHRITFYLMTLASSFHSYYNKHKVLTDETLLSAGRWRLKKLYETALLCSVYLLRKKCDFQNEKA